jgi:hypothetical protein
LYVNLLAYTVLITLAHVKSAVIPNPTNITINATLSVPN